MGGCEGGHNCVVFISLIHTHIHLRHPTHPTSITPCPPATLPAPPPPPRVRPGYSQSDGHGGVPEAIRCGGGREGGALHPECGQKPRGLWPYTTPCRVTPLCCWILGPGTWCLDPCATAGIVWILDPSPYMYQNLDPSTYACWSLDPGTWYQPGSISTYIYIYWILDPCTDSCLSLDPGSPPDHPAYISPLHHGAGPSAMQFLKISE